MWELAFCCGAPSAMKGSATVVQNENGRSGRRRWARTNSTSTRIRIATQWKAPEKQKAGRTMTPDRSTEG